jgi:hypothetical protein
LSALQSCSMSACGRRSNSWRLPIRSSTSQRRAVWRSTRSDTFAIAHASMGPRSENRGYVIGASGPAARHQAGSASVW